MKTIIIINKAVQTIRKSNKAVGSILTILGISIAAVIIILPLTRWQASLGSNAANIEEGFNNVGMKLEMESALEDRWKQINSVNLNEFNDLKTKTTKYGKYTVKESFSKIGKYNSKTGKCESGTPNENTQGCRVATLTVIGATDVLPLGPVTTNRVVLSKNTVKSDSLNHSIKLQYDESSNMVKTYVNNVETTIGVDTPDWSNPVFLVTSKANWPQHSIVYDAIMSETGYLKVMTCGSTIDFDIYINASNSLLSQAIVDDMTLHHSAYHKCLYAGSDDGNMIVHKGDRVTFFYRCNARDYTGVGGTSLMFIPIKRNQIF